MNMLARDLLAPSAAAGKIQLAAPRKGFWARVLDAIVESRSRKAERELRMHRHLVADLLARSEFKDSALPFARRDAS